MAEDLGDDFERDAGVQGVRGAAVTEGVERASVDFGRSMFRTGPTAWGIVLGTPTLEESIAF